MLGALEQSQHENTRMIEMVTQDLQNPLEVIMNLITPGTMKKEPVDMKSLIHYCVDLLRFKANEKKQSIQLKADDITLEIDREKIWRVLSNLITNAIKFSPEAGTIEIEMHKKQDVVQISVKDYGIGIPGNMKNNVFDAPSSIESSETWGERPFDLELSISKQIVQALGGKIWFESTEGQGTVFYVEFPVTK
jgi:signal transduction histidine kinase